MVGATQAPCIVESYSEPSNVGPRACEWLDECNRTASTAFLASTKIYVTHHLFRETAYVLASTGPHPLTIDNQAQISLIQYCSWFYRYYIKACSDHVNQPFPHVRGSTFDKVNLPNDFGS